MYIQSLSVTRRRRDIKNTVVPVSPCAEKFNIVGNGHGRTHKCDFSVFDRKFPFWENLVKENHNCQFKLKFGTYSNSNMQNSMVIFTFSVFDWN